VFGTHSLSKKTPQRYLKITLEKVKVIKTLPVSHAMRVPHGCPLCEDDVLGTPETGFFCRRCNLIFKRRQIVFRHAKEHVKGLIDKHFTGYGKGPERPRLHAAADRQELTGSVARTATSFEKLRRSVEEAKRFVEETEAGRLPPPAIVKEALQARQSRQLAATSARKQFVPKKSTAQKIVRRTKRRATKQVKAAKRAVKKQKAKSKRR
jgi:hypothetical protein